MFARVASGYDRLNRILSLGLDVAWRRRALRELGRCVPENPTHLDVLDLATGTADFAIAAVRYFPRARATGVDLTPEMLEIADRKVKAAGLSGMIELHQGDAAKLAFPDGTFDVALCAFGFRNFPDRAMSLSELARILKYGGRLVVLEFFRPRSVLMGGLTACWLKAATAFFARANADDYAYLRRSIEKTCSAETFKAEAEMAGFETERCRFFIPACTCLVLRKYGKMQTCSNNR